MFFNPYYFSYSPYTRIVPTISYVRLLHASPNAPSVDVYLDNILVAKNLSFKDFTEYLPVPTGLHNVKVFPLGNKTTPVINTNIFIPEGKIFTAVVMGLLDNIGLTLISEPIKTIPENKAMVRFIHLSPDTPNIDITLPNGTKLFEDVKYREVTDYIAVDPGLYTLQARLPENQKVILTVPNIRIRPNRFYSIYAVGLYSGKPNLQVLIPLDGNTYLKF